jgi:hypothetical protein
MSTSAVASPKIQYVVELQHSGLDVRLLLNNIEIASAGVADRAITQQKVNGWLLGGANELALYAAIPDPSHIQGPLDLKCLLFRGAHGRQPDEEEALAKFAERDKAKLPAGALQQVWKTSFPADPFYGPWLWSSAPVITLDSGTVQAALRIVSSVIDALNARNVQKLIDLFRVQIDENAAAYGMKVERIEQQLRGWAESWTAAPPRTILPDEYSLVVEGEQRLLRIQRKDGHSVFSTNPTASAPGLSRIYAARLARGLAIVR